MAARAALITGASSGIGLAIAHMLGSEGHGLTVAARRPEKLAAAAQELRDAGYDVLDIPGDLGDEAHISAVVGAHRERYGRLDVLVNNAGIGLGGAAGEISTKRADLQIGLNLRTPILFYREAFEMLRVSGAEHRNALVVNTASITGKHAEAWLSVYSATKYGLVGFSEAMNKELSADGIKSCALCPAFVDTPMTDFVKEQVPGDQMISPQDIAEGVRMLLRLSPSCIVPELIFSQPGGGPFGPDSP